MINNFYEKQVACIFDGISFMLRNKEGNQAKICRQQPGCVYMCCIALPLKIMASQQLLTIVTAFVTATNFVQWSQ